MKNSQLHLIVYVSHCEVEQSSLDKEIANICEVAVRENQRHEITGVLFCENGYFVQALEGPHSVLMTLLDNIRKDERNSDLNILIDKPISYRLFPEWGMRGLNLVDNTLFTPDMIRLLHASYEENIQITDAGFILYLDNMLNDANFRALFKK